MTVTDPKHLDTVTVSIARSAARLSALWLAEDADACAPRSAADGGPSTPGPSDPTGSIAATPDRFRSRDRIGRELVAVEQRLEALLAQSTPREPTGECSCCKSRKATHGARCWDCYLFWRNRRFDCGDAVHKNRPDPAKMCACPDACCPRDDEGHTSCDQTAAPGRLFSERCRKRMYRDPDKKAS